MVRSIESYPSGRGQTILVADDDRATVELARMYLEREGYRVFAAYDGKAAMDLAEEIHPDLVVLDWMMPEMDGLTVCERLRTESDVPIIMLTARVGESDRLVGLMSGADDYLVKPFSPRELAVRAGVILRRAHGGQSQRAAALQAGPIRIDTLQHEVWLDGREVALTPTEFNLLATLVREPRRVFSREHLIHLAFDDDPNLLPRTVDVHVNNLRRKLRRDDGSDLINTVYGVGYRLDP
ncbi:MAG: response regulator transcription factor [Chloroflexota bacterium]